jgi:pyridoxine kinase
VTGAPALQDKLAGRKDFLGTAMNILTIQSHVAYGYVGNRPAVFALQRLGFDVWVVNTVQFSNHLGYDRWAGDVFQPDHVARVTAATLDRGGPGRCDAVLSGFLGDHRVGETVLAAVARVRQANPGMLYLCDPVIGDRAEGRYVSDSVADFLMTKALPLADIVTPNLFELEAMTGAEIHSLDQALAAVTGLLAQGPQVVLLSSLIHHASREGTIEMLVATREGVWRVVTPRLRTDPQLKGTGDLLSALFLANYLKNRQPAEALSRTAASLFEVIAATQTAAAQELQIIAAQDRMAAPEINFEVTRIA